jgi:hypothetical protein
MRLACVVAVAGSLSCGDVATQNPDPLSSSEQGETSSVESGLCSSHHAPPPSSPVPPLDTNFRPLIGGWDCSGQKFASPFGPAAPLKMKLSFKRIVDGYWYSYDFVETDASTCSKIFAAHAMIGFDPASAKLTRRDHELFGGTTDLTSSGFSSAGSLQWEGANGFGAAFRETLTRVHNNKYTQKIELKLPGAAFAPLIDATCFRSYDD